jgi:hypothetical protein
MDNNLSYQKARSIRKQSLSSLLSDEIIQGSGVFSGIKKAISLKTQAKMKGIKEKFDPLNIAKVLTGGSRLGPALLGKITGRSRQDIENFAGRVKYVNPKNKKISALPPSEQESSGMKSVLISIVGLLKKTSEEDKKRRQKENNFAEERKLEDDKRHKELLKALGMVGGTASLVQEKEQTKGFFESIFDSLSDLMNMKNILKPLLSLLSTAGNWFLSFLLSPAGILLAGGVLAGALAYVIASSIGAGERKQTELLGGNKALAAKKILMKDQEDELFEKSNAQKDYDDAVKEKQDIVARIMEKRGYKRFNKTGWFGDKLEGQYVFEDKNGNEPPEQLMEAVSKEANVLIDQSDAIAAAKKQTATPAAAAPVPQPTNTATPANTAPQSKSGIQVERTSPVTPISAGGTATQSFPLTTPTPVPTSQKLNSVINENVSLNLDANVATSQQSLVNNVVANKRKNPTRETPMPSVRNQDDTFQRMIVGSTRVV